MKLLPCCSIFHTFSNVLLTRRLNRCQHNVCYWKKRDENEIFVLHLYHLHPPCMGMLSIQTDPTMPQDLCSNWHSKGNFSNSKRNDLFLFERLTVYRRWHCQCVHRLFWAHRCLIIFIHRALIEKAICSSMECVWYQKLKITSIGQQ